MVLLTRLHVAYVLTRRVGGSGRSGRAGGGARPRRRGRLVIRRPAANPESRGLHGSSDESVQVQPPVHPHQASQGNRAYFGSPTAKGHASGASSRIPPIPPDNGSPANRPGRERTLPTLPTMAAPFREHELAPPGRRFTRRIIADWDRMKALNTTAVTSSPSTGA
jgi:hypothetical protein